MSENANECSVYFASMPTPAAAVEGPCGSKQQSSRVVASSTPTGVTGTPMGVEALVAGSTFSSRRVTSRVVTWWQKVCDFMLNC